MKIKVQKRIKKTFAVLAAVMLAVCSMAFSVSADEVIFNGSLPYVEDLNGYEFPNYIPLTVGDTYSLTYNGVTDTAQVNPPFEDVPVPFVLFQNLGLILVSGDFGNGNQTGLLFQAVDEPPSSIDVILSKASAPVQDQVVFDSDVQFSSISGSFVGTFLNPGVTFLPDREYLVEVNGIEKTYTSALIDDVIWIGPYPPTERNFSMAILRSDNVNNGQPTLTINADNLLSSAGTYPVKITLLSNAPSFLRSVTKAIGSVLSWVGIPINEMLNDGGALVALLPLFGIGISIAAIFVGIKLIRSFTWGD